MQHQGDFKLDPALRPRLQARRAPGRRAAREAPFGPRPPRLHPRQPRSQLSSPAVGPAQASDAATSAPARAVTVFTSALIGPGHDRRLLDHRRRMSARDAEHLALGRRRRARSTASQCARDLYFEKKGLYIC